MFGRDQGLIQRWNRGERLSTERENSSRRRGVPVKQSSGYRLKFFQSRPNWTPPAQRNHQDTSRIKAQKPNRAEIRSSPRIKRESPLEKTEPARQENSREENLPKVQKSTAINSKRSQDFNVLIIHQRFRGITQGNWARRWKLSAACTIRR